MDVTKKLKGKMYLAFAGALFGAFILSSSASSYGQYSMLIDMDRKLKEMNEKENNPE